MDQLHGAQAVKPGGDEIGAVSFDGDHGQRADAMGDRVLAQGHRIAENAAFLLQPGHVMAHRGARNAECGSQIGDRLTAIAAQQGDQAIIEIIHFGCIPM